jgi:predicted DNA-binding transcriptional regulator AlpA
MPNDTNGRDDDDDLIKIATVMRMAALSRSAVYVEMKKGFPKQVRPTGRSVAWVRGEVKAWIAQRKAQRSG